MIDNNSHKAPASVRLEGLFFNAALRRNNESIAWQERRPTIVDVPHAQGQRERLNERSTVEEREGKEREKASAGGSQLPQCSVTQQSGAAPQTQPSSQSNAAVSTLSTTPALAATSAAAASLPDITIRQAGHWTRFWLRFCCHVSGSHSPPPAPPDHCETTPRAMEREAHGLVHYFHSLATEIDPISQR
ncbi:hypothetical protein M405DRAFT_878224 [Rhizopogon salebrosus TDB-379]|nr:hypothetical protein M405DRAFT_878224 [Rhizopogon salebrosus TDB-379]